MGSKILSFATLALSLGACILLIIAAIMPTPQTLGDSATLTLCLVSAAIFLLALRFNVTAIRHDLTQRMLLPNTGLLFVSLFLIYIFIRHFVIIPEFITYIILGCLVGGFIIVFIAYWVLRRRSY